MTSFSPAEIRGLIIDMDGVLWRGSEPVGNLPAVFSCIRRLELKIVLATNNATRAPHQYLEKLRGFGVELGLEEVMNSAMAAARYLKKLHPQGGPIFIVGEEGLKAALLDEGFFHSEDQPLAVVAGMDRTFTYQKLDTASAFVRDHGALLLATNPDPTFPTPTGLTPGAGSIIAAIEAASETKAVIAGKPSPALYETCMDRMGTLPQQTLVIGDRLTTDIAGGQALGCPTALVLSGVTSMDQARSWKPLPDWIEPDFGDVISRLERSRA
jgi:4-nitrophenyl phosphatase